MGVVTDNLGFLLGGLLVTLELTAIGFVGAMVLGTVLAVFRVSPIPPLRAAGAVYVEVLRNMPLLSLLVLVVFGLPDIGLTFSLFTSSALCLAAFGAAFVCEAVRGGINTVPVGQAEAARALGFTFAQTLGQIVLPQAFRAVVPPLTSVMIALLKNTTIAAGFSVFEAGGIYQNLSERGYDVLVGLLWVALFFLILVLPLTGLQRTLEKRWRVAT